MYKEYQERKFDTWSKGLIHLIIVIIIPIVPIFVYLFTNDIGNYLYFLIFTVILSLGYEFLNSNINCSIWIKIENIISALSLSVLLVWDLFMILLLNTNNNSFDNDVFLCQTICWLFVFSVPIIATSIEIIRSIVAYIKTGEFSIDKNRNLVNGAKGI